MKFLIKENSKKLTYKDIVRKINYQLTKNFFTLKEINSLHLKKVKKIVKIISKIEKIKLKRKEINDIALFLKSNLSIKTKSASKLWDFLDLVDEKIKLIKEKWLILFSLFFINNYRKNKYELMLN